jgi:(p)ppGpp synthase/HD superfamily hydrolase
MLASILRSDKAIQMNIAIVEAFIALRSFSMNYNSLANRIKELEQKYSRQFNDVYEALKYLLEKDKIEGEQENRNKIGY